MARVTRFFDDLRNGDRFQTDFSDVITQSTVDAYLRLTGDQFRIHSDHGFAIRFGLKTAMVPGNLVVALSTGLVYAAGHFTDSLVVQARKDVIFCSPVFTGQQIYVVETVVDLEPLRDLPYGRVLLERLVFDEQHERKLLIEQDYRIARRIE